MESNTTQKLNENEMVVLAQKCLSELGIAEASIHPHKKIVRIQVAEVDFDRAIQMRETIVERIENHRLPICRSRFRRKSGLEFLS